MTREKNKQTNKHKNEWQKGFGLFLTPNDS